MTSSTDWPNYWKNRWVRNDTGWHQTETEPALVSFFAKSEPSRVLVPLCGKSKDLLWLVENGHEVVGVELSELACESFFNENKISFEKIKTSDSIEYRGKGIKIFNQDLFTITDKHLGKIDALYDRAALIALPPELRTRYTEHLTSLLKKCSDPSLEFCQILLERVPSDSEGPPFSVDQKELETLYSRSFSIDLISRDFLDETDKFKRYECVYRLRMK